MWQFYRRAAFAEGMLSTYRKFASSGTEGRQNKRLESFM
jgi:hypothetical protein